MRGSRWLAYVSIHAPVGANRCGRVGSIGVIGARRGIKSLTRHNLSSARTRPTVAAYSAFAPAFAGHGMGAAGHSEQQRTVEVERGFRPDMFDLAARVGAEPVEPQAIGRGVDLGQEPAP